MEGWFVIETPLLVARAGAEIDTKRAMVVGHEGADRVVGKELGLPFAEGRMDRRIPPAPVMPKKHWDLTLVLVPPRDPIDEPPLAGGEERLGGHALDSGGDDSNRVAHLAELVVRADRRGGWYDARILQRGAKALQLRLVPRFDRSKLGSLVEGAVEQLIGRVVTP
jgi:hypothetical protein